MAAILSQPQCVKQNLWPWHIYQYTSATDYVTITLEIEHSKESDQSGPFKKTL